jgi:hypothetical protein
MHEDEDSRKEGAATTDSTRTNSELWFSQREDRYNAELNGTQKVFYWTGQPQMWDWDNCTVSWLWVTGRGSARASSRRLRVVIRGFNSVSSEYRKKDVEIRYMLGFDVEASKIQPPEEEEYPEPLDNKEKRYGEERTRWVMRLDNDRSIWQWKDEGQPLECSEVYGIYKDMIKSPDNPPYLPSEKNFFNVSACDDNEIGKQIVPVVYQPAIDSEEFCEGSPLPCT